ncbi:carbon-nitrogen hydrolase family protein [Rubrobacter tropicus]|uniref:carbon-nitrogen hydrolase family protein n=1 Tax=Rubrobacter tropicus TaxID=2653851 RepID=UPI001D18904D|nr:carbon-nitrogen hydrolase family protein [Rubrobacter tropicus]
MIRADFTGGSPMPTQAVATLNLGPKPGDLEHNLSLAERAIREAKSLEPDLRWVVLPELFTCGYSALETVHLSAEDAERGESARFFVSLARELGLCIAYGFAETVPGSVTGVFDSANLVGAGGVIATYRKRNLVETTPEYRVFTPGVELPVVEAGGLRVALAVCWDLGFPEVAREAAARGADLVLAPAAWRDPWGAQYGLACAARALDSGIHLASANQIGDYPEARFSATGHVYGPDGARISHGFGAASLADMDPGAPERWRGFYGDTLPERERVSVVGGEPLEIERSAVSPLGLRPTLSAVSRLSLADS